MKETFNLTYLGLFPLGRSPSGKGMGIKMIGWIIAGILCVLLLGIATAILVRTSAFKPEEMEPVKEEKVERNFQSYVFGPIPTWEEPKLERHGYKNEKGD